MIIGFTGTRRGMTPIQRARVRHELFNRTAWFDRGEFHHGDCIGADAQAHELAAELGYATHAHPPTDPSWRTRCAADVVHEALPYLERDRVIAAVCDVLVAAPDGPERLRGSGTWATVRAARRMGRAVVVVGPDGSQMTYGASA